MRELALLVVVCLSGACEIGLPAGAEPHRELNFLDMADQPKLKPQRADLLGERPNGMVEPPAGTLAVDQVPYPFTQEQGDLAAVLVNPLTATPENIARGKWVFEHVCITCHGPEAAGDGHLTRLFPKPPSLMTQKIRDWSDGRIYHLPMRGQGSMPSQVSVVAGTDIWAAVLYLRSLQGSLPVAPPAADTPKTEAQP
jgi:mono/diheme cytochrome c family protein